MKSNFTPPPKFLLAAALGIIFSASSMFSQSQNWWRTNGNTPQSTDFLGTSNSTPLIIKTNDVERIRIAPNGFVGIGNSNPQYVLDVSGRTKLRYNVYCDSLLQASHLIVNNTIQTSTIDAQQYLLNGQPAVFSQWTNISPTAIAYNGDVYVNSLNAQSGISIGNFKFRNGAAPPQRDSIKSDRMVSFVADKSIEFRADTIRFSERVGIGRQPAMNVALDVNGNVAVSGSLKVSRVSSVDSLLRIGDSTLAFNQNYNRLYALNAANGRYGIGIGASADGYGINAVALGTSSEARGTSAITIGKNVKTNAGGFAIVIGSGVDVANKLENTMPNSVMIGANSKVPSVFIAPSNNMNEAGNIGFGIIPPPAAPAGYVDPVKYEFNGSVSVRNNGNAGLFFGRDNISNSNLVAYYYGEWGIQYVKSVDNNNNGGGLNFWKPYQSSGISGNGFLWLGDNGNVGVGCTNPQYKLDVVGTIRAKEVRVKVTGCDFVLEKPYLLEPLKLRREKVLSDKHLPHLPNANGEVEMNTREWMEGIWQNVEEHELYLYELYEKIQQLERENMILKQKIEEMKK